MFYFTEKTKQTFWPTQEVVMMMPFSEIGRMEESHTGLWVNVKGTVLATLVDI